MKLDFNKKSCKNCAYSKLVYNYEKKVWQRNCNKTEIIDDRFKHGQDFSVDSDEICQYYSYDGLSENDSVL